MKHPLLLPVLLVLLLLTGTALAASPPALLLNRPMEDAVGLYSSYLKEGDNKLTLEQAMAAYQQGQFSVGRSEILNFGIGSRPVWLHLTITNPAQKSLQRRLSINTAWLDQVDLYLVQQGEEINHYHTGDREPYGTRPIASRYFSFDLGFAPGNSELFIRIETPDPLVLPLYLQSLPEAHRQESHEDYSYGFLYGFLMALLAYNLMLYAGLRDSRYLLYSIYLGMFALMNVSYSGHGFEWLWPNNTVWAQWSNPVLMVLYGVSGLLFALRFLDVRTHFPRLYKGVAGYITGGLALQLLAFLLDSQRYALFISFSFVFLFTVIMLLLGVIAIRSGQTPAKYFLLAAIAAIIGAATTALSVWGIIPTTLWTYRAVDIGITLEATLLALALTYQFRLSQIQKLRAEQLAMLDPLTGLSNRRSFYNLSVPIWNIAQRHNSHISVILLDIDRFKNINDAFGHAAGDDVLRAIAKVLQETVRDQDVVVRWGGEEFLLLLPETDLHEAVALAERLRSAIASQKLKLANSEIQITASFGVAQRTDMHSTLDGLVSEADRYLYQSKESGRDLVSHASMAVAKQRMAR